MKAYKGFNKDLQCNPIGTPFQFEIGKEYEEDRALLCSTGFHACENPLDVFTYYNSSDGRFCEVELDANDETGDDSKRAGKHIKIDFELSLMDLIKAGVKFIFDKSIVSDRSHSATIGDWSNSATTGDRSHSATTGDWSNSATTGYRSNSATTGDRAHSATEKCIAAALGVESMAKGKLGCFIVVAEWVYDNDINNYKVINCKSHKVDGKTIKPDTYYKLVGGKFVKGEE